MRLKILQTHTLPIEVFMKDHDLRDRVFGVRGHNPLHVRLEETHAFTIWHQDNMLVRVRAHQRTMKEGMSTIFTYEPTHAITAHPEVAARLQRAADAIINKIEASVLRHHAREEDVRRRAYEIIGPADTSKAVNKLDIDNAVMKFCDFLFPGVAERVLPHELHLGEMDRKMRSFEVSLIARDEDITQTILRMRTDHRDVFALGPGDRKAGRINFITSLMEDAHQLLTRTAEDQDFVAQAQDLIARHAGTVAQAATQIRSWDRIGATSRESPSWRLASIERARSHTDNLRSHPLEDTDFSVAQNVMDPQGFLLLFRDVPVAHSELGGLTPFQTRSQALTQSAFVAGLIEHPLFAPRSSARDCVMQIAGINPADAAYKAVLNDAAEPDVDIFL